MARKPRIHEPGGYYHVMLRGNGGDPVFFSTRDRLFFYSLLKDAPKRFDCRIHAFCLMTNHVHLVVQVGETSLSKIVQTIAMRHTRKINKQKKRIGHLFQGRFKAILADEQSYLLELVRYVHLNPVRAGLVGTASEWKWSGHNAYLGKERIEWLTRDAVLGQFGGREGVARGRYAAFIAEGSGEETAAVLRKGKAGGRIIGDDMFVEKTLKNLSGEEMKRDVPFGLVVKSVAKALGVAEKEIYSPHRERRASKARALVCLLANRHCKITLTEIARTFGRDDGGLSRLIRRYEEVAAKDESENRLVAAIEKTLQS